MPSTPPPPSSNELEISKPCPKGGLIDDLQYIKCVGEDPGNQLSPVVQYPVLLKTFKILFLKILSFHQTVYQQYSAHFWYLPLCLVKK